LEEFSAGIRVDDIYRKHDIGNIVYHICKNKYDGMDVFGVKRMRELKKKILNLKNVC